MGRTLCSAESVQGTARTLQGPDEVRPSTEPVSMVFEPARESEESEDIRSRNDACGYGIRGLLVVSKKNVYLGNK